MSLLQELVDALDVARGALEIVKTEGGYSMEAALAKARKELTRPVNIPGLQPGSAATDSRPGSPSEETVEDRARAYGVPPIALVITEAVGKHHGIEDTIWAGETTTLLEAIAGAMELSRGSVPPDLEAIAVQLVRGAEELFVGNDEYDKRELSEILRAFAARIRDHRCHD